METSTCNMLLRFGSHISLPFPDHVDSNDKHTLPFSYRFGFTRSPRLWYDDAGGSFGYPGGKEKSNTKTLSW